MAAPYSYAMSLASVMDDVTDKPALAVATLVISPNTRIEDLETAVSPQKTGRLKTPSEKQDC